jgi:hypothetical protein
MTSEGKGRYFTVGKATACFNYATDDHHPHQQQASEREGKTGVRACSYICSKLDWKKKKEWKKKRGEMVICSIYLKHEERREFKTNLCHNQWTVARWMSGSRFDWELLLPCGDTHVSRQSDWTNYEITVLKRALKVLFFFS